MNSLFFVVWTVCHAASIGVNPSVRCAKISTDFYSEAEAKEFKQKIITEDCAAVKNILQRFERLQHPLFFEDQAKGENQ